jgi:anti-sigma B factor antagonist
MKEKLLTISLRSESPNLAVIYLAGFMSAQSEKRLEEFYTNFSLDNIQTVVFNFTNLEGMDASGLVHLTTFLSKIRRGKYLLKGYGLSERVRRLFELTHLDEIIQLFSDEREALSTPIAKG